MFEQLKLDINLGELNALTETDLAIWATPEGTMYVDSETRFLARALHSLILILFLQY